MNMTSKQYREHMAKMNPGAPAPAKVVIVHQGARLNKTEAAYRDLLEFRKRAGDVADYWVQAWTVTLADRARYTPDFLVRYPDGRLEFVEVKGFLRDDALVKFKVAAALAPWAAWVMVRRGKGGRWEELYRTPPVVTVTQLTGSTTNPI